VDKTATALSDADWARLRPVGELRVAPIVFTRGSVRISLESERDLQALARRLQSFPTFYVRVIGHTRAEGDPEANRRLAQARAEAAADFLRAQGVRPERVRTEASPATPDGTEALAAVSFVVGQMPY
jgi:outer membrane protein OmpA-like peptidoglycan-associated protein